MLLAGCGNEGNAELPADAEVLADSAVSEVVSDAGTTNVWGDCPELEWASGRVQYDDRSHLLTYSEGERPRSLSVLPSGQLNYNSGILYDPRTDHYEFLPDHGSSWTKNPFPSHLGGAVVGASTDGKTLYAVGGVMSAKAVSNVSTLDIATGAQGTLPSTLSPMSEPWLGTLPGGGLLVFGWFENGDLFEVFDPIANAWSRVPTPPGFISDEGIPPVLKSVEHGEYAVGSIGGGDCGRMWMFDREASTWLDELPEMPVRVQGPTITELAGGKLMLAGGVRCFDSYRYVDSVQLFDPDSRTWTTLPSLPREAKATRILPLPCGRVLAVGGCQHDNPDVTSIDDLCEGRVHLYDPTANRWAANVVLPPLAVVSYPNAVLVGDTVVVTFGVLDDPGQVVRDEYVPLFLRPKKKK